MIFQEEIPKYVQISNHIKRLIETKNIEDGEKLPTIREYTNYLGVNKVTIINAYHKLQNDGFAYQKVGSGTYAKVKEIRPSFSKEYSRVFRKLSSGNTKDAIDFAGETNNEVVFPSGTYAKVKEIRPSFSKEYSRVFRKLSSGNTKDAIDFAGETNNEVVFPIEEFKSIINKVLDRDGAEALISQNALGYENLRYTINEVFWDNSINNENILIVSGAQQGIDIASKAILNINDNVIVEKPTYGGALSVFKWRRANIFEVEMEKDGVNLEDFEEILKKNKIRCFYTMSYFQNPTGVSYSLEKKKKLIELAEKYDFYIIEDDYLSELIYEESMSYFQNPTGVSYSLEKKKKLIELAEKYDFYIIEDDYLSELIYEESVEYIPFKWLDRNDRVIYIKSFSKIFLPGIRIGYIVTPNIFRESMQNSKFNTDIATSSLMQRALELYIKDGAWKDNISYLNVEYKKRYELMSKLIDEELGDMVTCNKPGGGLTFYLKIADERVTSRELFLRLSKKNVYITPGVLFFRNMSDGDRTFRIGFSQTNEEKIKKGLKLIREELETWHI